MKFAQPATKKEISMTEQANPGKAVPELCQATLRIENLSKRYGDQVLFHGLTQAFQPGCVALCEEESNGKSTLLGVLAGAVAPDVGDIWIEGHSMIQAPRRAKARVAYVPDNCLAFPTLTGRGLLEQAASEKNAALDAALDLVSKLELEPHLHKRFEQMSTGTRRKVYLAAAVLGDPAVIIADGPSNGLDKQACAVLAEQFKAWSRHRVVLVASHDAELVQACGARMVKVSDLS